MADRTSISTLFNSDSPFKIGRIDDKTAEKHGISNHHGDIGIFDCLHGKLVAFLGEDDLFDPDGNRFYLDE